LKDASKIELAYCAGIIDGEGCFSLGRTTRGGRAISPKWYCKVSVDMTDRRPLEILSDLFKGKISPRKPQILGHKPGWIWQRWDLSAGEVASNLLPFLQVKKAQAELILEYLVKKNQYKVPGPILLSDKEKERRNYFVERMHELNA